MKMTDGLFIRCAEEVHRVDYPNIDYEEVIIDAGCMRLVQNPGQFDMLLLENLYGDVVSDLCAGLVGGLGVVPGANIGEHGAIFEAVHGSAPDIAGKGLANPMAQILCVAMMLRFSFDLGEAAAAIETAVRRTLDDGLRTPDIAQRREPTVGTSAIGDAVVRNLG